MSNRERLVKELHKIIQENPTTPAFKIADFILARDKRIVEPLVKYKSDVKLWDRREWGLDSHTISDEAIDECLKLAGGE